MDPRLGERHGKSNDDFMPSVLFTDPLSRFGLMFKTCMTSKDEFQSITDDARGLKR
jgi:hypothetical protein